MLKNIILCLILFITPETISYAESNKTAIKQFIIISAHIHKIPPSLLLEVCRRESNFVWFSIGDKDNKTIVRNDSGEIIEIEENSSLGICQISMNTWKFIIEELAPPSMKIEVYDYLRLMDLDYNSELSAIYLKWLYKRYGNWRMALAAYNSGHNKSLKFLKNKTKKGSYSMTVYTRWEQNKISFEQNKFIKNTIRKYELEQRIKKYRKILQEHKK